MRLLNQYLSNSSFPVRLTYTEQDVAPFLDFHRDGCQGFVGPDPSTFLNENAICVKERLRLTPNKKALLILHSKGLFRVYLNVYTKTLMYAIYTYTCSSMRVYLRYVGMKISLHKAYGKF